jgi:hypothetical protein
MTPPDILLANLDQAERDLRTHLTSQPASAFYPGQDPGETLRRQALADQTHIAQTTVLAALLAAAAARVQLHVVL